MEKLAVLSSSPLFEMLSNVELQGVADLVHPRHFTAGQNIFEEGELGDSLYVIVQGEVEVLRREVDGSERSLAILEASEFFGEMSLLDKEVRSATARARTDAELLHLSAENLTSFRARHPDGFTLMVINIARVLSMRLREANARVV